ncbi:unnamed protein product [Musa hybrid cultivar]
MEETRSRRKRRRPPPPVGCSSFNRTVFPLLLAAAATSSSSSASGDLQNPHARFILRRFLRARLALLTTRTPPCSSPSALELLLPEGLLTLFPVLLTSRWPSVAALGAEVVGAASLYSLEANEMMASDEGVVKGLVRALGSKSRRIVKAALRAVMDLSTSPVGREQLWKASAVERLLSFFYQLAKTSAISAVHHSMEKGSDVCSNRRPVEEKIVALVLDVMVILINTSTEILLNMIPRDLVNRSLPLLQELWKKIRGASIPRNWGRCLHFTEYDLASTIFRLSMKQANPAPCEIDKIRISIFGNEISNFENFMLKYWENSPFLLSGSSNILEKDNAVFSSLVHSLNPTSTDDVLDSILMELVSCPPLASDELDINCFMNEMNSSLGSPLIYGQDIRVLKARELMAESFKNYVKKEVHFFENGMRKVFIDGDNAQKCKEAFQNGFTVALRGMEFRFAKVAAIAKGLEVLFGQPSVGANLYLTPPGSQGLAHHYDDHCVFVWQLFGQKHWTISYSPTSVLPRLYEPLSSFPCLESEKGGGLQLTLNEGDILYIPRGYPHEAHTNTDASESQNNMSSGFSLHLTLSIEVEPPFEWEGFAHVALHCWHEKEKELSDSITSSEARTMRILSVFLLHVAIRLTANCNPIFRKACLVAAKLGSAEVLDEPHSEALMLSQKTTFWNIMNIIRNSSNFMEVYKIVAVIQESNDDSLQWMRWLRHLPQDGADDAKIDFSNLLRMWDKLVEFKGNGELKDEFFKTKSKFCTSVVYEDACKMFHMLLERYRRTRRQYMCGMLSLHSA